jgi:hypothetical protein
LEKQALAIVEAALGPSHPETAVRLNNLGVTYLALEKAGDALPLLERAMVITEASVGSDHPTIATRLANLAVAYVGLGRAAEAIVSITRAEKCARKGLGADHPKTRSLKEQANHIRKVYGFPS